MYLPPRVPSNEIKCILPKNVCLRNFSSEQLSICVKQLPIMSSQKKKKKKQSDNERCRNFGCLAFRNTMMVQVWFLFIWLSKRKPLRGERAGSKEGRKNAPRMKSSTGKFGLVNEENLICSALDVLRRRRQGCRASTPRRLYRRPLCGLLLSALVFINGMTCSWSLDFRRWNVSDKCNSSADSIVTCWSVLFIIEKNL